MKNFQPISSFDDDSTEETSEGTSPKIIRARCRNAFNNARIKAWKRKDSKYTQLFRTFAYEDIEGPVLGGNDTDTDYDDHDEEIEDAVPQGTIPHLNTNIRHKAVTISYSHPQFFVEGEDMNANFAVQELFKRLWEYNGWRKRTRKASLKSFISGTGICAVLWNQERGVVVENITPKDFLFDPYLLDFDNLRWAARRFMMPAEEALELYPKLSEYMKNDEEIEDDGSKASMVTLWCYWDQQTEAILYEWNVLKSEPNAYGDVPIEVYENEDDPDNAYATGDYDSCLGLQSQHTMMMDALNEQGRNGGSFTMINSNILSAKDRENLETGQLSALIAVEGLPEESIYRVPASPINPAQQFSIQAMERAIDGRTGVTPESRGQPDPNAKFATQVAIANKMQGAVGQDQSAGFERFVNCIINRALNYMRKFMVAETPEEQAVLLALNNVKAISIVEGSMAYQDPAYQAQNTMMAIQTGMGLLKAGYQIDIITLYRKLLQLMGFKNAQQIAPDAPAMPTNPMANRTPQAISSGVQGGGEPTPPTPM